jgi:hypothetical protein
LLIRVHHSCLLKDKTRAEGGEVAFAKQMYAGIHVFFWLSFVLPVQLPQCLIWFSIEIYDIQANIPCAK